MTDPCGCVCHESAEGTVHVRPCCPAWRGPMWGEVGAALPLIAERIARLIEAVDPVEWALAGQHAGQDAARLIREAFPGGDDG